MRRLGRSERDPGPRAQTFRQRLSVLHVDHLFGLVVVIHKPLVPLSWRSWREIKNPRLRKGPKGLFFCFSICSKICFLNKVLIFLELILRKHNYHHLLSFWSCSARGIVWSIDIYCVGIILHSSLTVHSVYRTFADHVELALDVTSTRRRRWTGLSTNISHLIPSHPISLLDCYLSHASSSHAKCESKERHVQFAFVAFEAAVSVICRFSAWWTWLDSTRKTYSIELLNIINITQMQFVMHKRQPCSSS